MLSRRGRSPTVAAGAAALAAHCTLAAPAHANPATVDYQCKPALHGGGPLSVDFNSGDKSVTLQFPDGTSIHMPGRTSRSYFLYSGEHTKIYGMGQKTITLTVMGQPTRRCVASL
jgi:membrane-bound inhibitor of C-type lysozyme